MSEELTDSNTNHESLSLRIVYLKSFCKPTYRVKWVKNKGAILIIIWSYLVTSVYHLLRTGYDPQQQKIYPNGIMMITILIFFPIGGWLADTHFGRYKTIRYSMWIMWIALILATFSELLAQGSVLYQNHFLRNPILYVLAIVVLIGFGGFQSNIVQLGITQLSNASTMEIASFITWYVLTLYMSGVTIQFTTTCIVPNDPDVHFLYIKIFVVALLLTVALTLDFLFHHCLDKEKATGKSVSLIFKVVKFTVKHRHSFTTECERPSWFNVAKQVYGGPFTSQQVEDVESILRIIMLVAVCSIVCSAITPIQYATQKIEHNLLKRPEVYGLNGCYERLSIQYNDLFFSIGIIVLYEFVIHPLFYKCLPRLRITSQFLLGMVLFLFRILVLIGIETAIYTDQQHTLNSTKCIFTGKFPDIVNIDYKWLLIPGLISALSNFLFMISAVEFIWAQTPYFMTGLAFGITYAFLGLYTIIQSAVAYPFLFADDVPWNHYPLTCGIWYFLMQAVIALIAFIVGLIVVKKYKERTRYDSSALSSNFYKDTAINQGPFC